MANNFCKLVSSKYSIRYIFSLILVLSFVTSSAQDSARVDYNVNLDSILSVKNNAVKGQAYPAFVHHTLSGKRITAKSLRGKVTLLNFWFAACPPCITEMPMLNRLYRRALKYKDFQCFGITYDPPVSVKKQRKQENCVIR
jgi:cytochrome oxidase Cu insertion factor (SCO1/SenC/PrrC family)